MMIKSIVHGKDTYKWSVLVTVSIGCLTASLDNSILAPCLPRLAQAFQTDSGTISWVNIAYLVATLSCMLTLAKIGDAKGRKRVYMISMTVYILGLLGCALSEGIGQLICARAFQGIGASALFSLSMAMAVAVFPAEERGRTLGILTSVYSTGLVAGPVFGGFILDLLGWRAVFYTRIPLAMASFAMVWLVIKEQKSENLHFQLDARGAVGLFCFLSCLLLFLSFGGKWGFGSIPVLILAALAAVFLVFFLYSEKRSAQPIVNLTFFRKPLFAAATLSAAIYGVSTIMAVFLLPFYLMEGLKSTGSVVGVFMALMALPVVFISPISGRLSDRIGPKLLSCLGMIVACFALFHLSRLTYESTYVQIGTGVVLVGCSMGVFQPPNNNAIVGSVPKDALGTASAIALTARQLGVSSGLAMGGALFASHKAHNLTRLSEQGIGLALAQNISATISFHDALMIGLMIGTVGIFISLVGGSRKED
jgi:EmrB/QacA subfamily drug resistance transporter